MTELGKVIKESEEAIDILSKIDEPTFYADFVRCAFEKALSLLKEQEAVPPEREYSGGGRGFTWWHVCGACRVAINPNDKYCHECGRPVKWDADGA